jgi:hypothetical protein
MAQAHREAVQIFFVARGIATRKQAKRLYVARKGRWNGCAAYVEFDDPDTTEWAAAGLCCRDHNQHRVVVSQRRSRQFRSVGFLSAIRAANSTCKRSWRPTSMRIPGHFCLVRQPLAGRGHPCGSPRSPRRRDPASVVRQRHPAHHPCSPRFVLHRHPVDARSGQVEETQTMDYRVVFKIRSDLQRCHRGSSTRNMGASDFFHVTATPRPFRNSNPCLAPNAVCLARGLNRPKSS